MARPYLQLAVAGACVALAATLAWKPRPFLLWNASASSPIGLYAVGSPAHLAPGDFVIAWPPPAARHLAAGRGYLPTDVPLVKRIAAVAGDRVCARRAAIMLDGQPVAARRSSDRAGRTLPWWSGCTRLRRGELFLLSPGRSDAFDGRYFGLTEPAQVIGRGILLWRA